MKRKNIDKGKEFDFGRTSDVYAKYRDIYPKSMYDKLFELGIGKSGQKILDLGSGTAVLPLNLCHTGARFVAADISENQITQGMRTVEERGIKNIEFKVCCAEDTGFESDSFDVVTAVQCFQYFDAEKAAEEIHRILKPKGVFCKIFMDWKPFEDFAIYEMEKLVLKYNPDWSGKGFREYNFTFPEWAKGRFEIEDVISYDVELEFSKEAWLGRVKSCRGVGASLSQEKTAEFENEYRELLEKYTEPLKLKHQIHIEKWSVVSDQ